MALERIKTVNSSAMELFKNKSFFEKHFLVDRDLELRKKKTSGKLIQNRSFTLHTPEGNPDP